jgi:ABC-type multidrug transport system ATPase subunit
LSEVAATGRIVLVATHAMESVELAQALCVLVGGRVAFFGPPRNALSYFRVDRYADLFRQLDKQSPSAWHLTASSDVDQQTFLRRAGPAPPPPASPVNGADGVASAEDGMSSADEALDRLKARMRSAEAL